jgi:AcrR family transcriptional regulator
MQSEFDKILQKVSSLYRRYGIKSVTMDDVAHELGMSKKTLYQYVNDKEELVKKVVEHTRLCNFTSMNEMKDFSGNAIEMLVEVSRRVNALLKDHSPSYEYDLNKYYPDIYEGLKSAHRKMMYESMIANIRQGKKEGVYRKELDEEIIAKLHLLRIEGIQSGDIFNEDEMRSSKFFVEVFVYHIHGMATAKGVEILEKNMEKLKQLEAH